MPRVAQPPEQLRHWLPSRLPTGYLCAAGALRASISYLLLSDCRPLHTSLPHGTPQAQPKSPMPQENPHLLRCQ